MQNSNPEPILAEDHAFSTSEFTQIMLLISKVPEF